MIFFGKPISTFPDHALVADVNSTPAPTERRQNMPPLIAAGTIKPRSTERIEAAETAVSVSAAEATAAIGEATGARSV
jgi:hypothetical protein